MDETFLLLTLLSGSLLLFGASWLIADLLLYISPLQKWLDTLPDYDDDAQLDELYAKDALDRLKQRFHTMPPKTESENCAAMAEQGLPAPETKRLYLCLL